MLANQNSIDFNPIMRDRAKIRISCAVALAAVMTTCIGTTRLAVPAAFAAEETCNFCGQQVSISGDFVHRKSDPTMTIEGATNGQSAFREEINGTNFTVTIAHLPAGKYTITIGEAETLVNDPGERSFDVTSGTTA